MRDAPSGQVTYRRIQTPKIFLCLNFKRSPHRKTAIIYPSLRRKKPGIIFYIYCPNGGPKSSLNPMLLGPFYPMGPRRSSTSFTGSRTKCRIASLQYCAGHSATILARKYINSDDPQVVKSPRLSRQIFRNRRKSFSSLQLLVFLSLLLLLPLTGNFF